MSERRTNQNNLRRLQFAEFSTFKFASLSLAPLTLIPGIDLVHRLDRVTGIPGWYWILGIKRSDTTGVGLVY